MAATLGEGLVFNLNHGGTRTFKVAHRALHVEGIPKARIGIHNDWHAHAVGDIGQCVGHLAGCGQANVRAAQAGVGNGRAR